MTGEPFDLPLEQPDYETLFHTVIRENTLLELEITRLRAKIEAAQSWNNDQRWFYHDELAAILGE